MRNTKYSVMERPSPAGIPKEWKRGQSGWKFIGPVCETGMEWDWTGSQGGQVFLAFRIPKISCHFYQHVTQHRYARYDPISKSYVDNLGDI
jgi:hypothetical protein